MANVFDEHGKLITGAGGGQASECILGSSSDHCVEPRPVDAPGPIPSAADLARYFAGLYCPVCVFGPHFEVGLPSGTHETPGGELCKGKAVPGLHSRCPETRVEGLDYVMKVASHGNWYLPGAIIHPAHAADLLVMGATRDVQKVEISRMANDRFCAVIYNTIDLNGPRGVGYGGTRAEAVALAMHRAKDSEEAQ